MPQGKGITVPTSIHQIQSVFLNLGINVAHAMPEGGTLSIHTKRTEVSSAHCETSPFPLEAGAHINIEFRDTGTEILPENMERIFEPFFTTKEPGRGTGLGLSAGYGIVQQHKGAITVYSEPGRGSSFHILLPLTDQPFATNTPPETPVHGKGVILLVDDEAVMRTIGSTLLAVRQVKRPTPPSSKTPHL